MARVLIVALASLLAVAVAGGCGGSGEGASSSGAAPDESGVRVPAGVATQYETIEKEVAAEGGEKRVGPWRIAYIVEPAEGWFERRGDDYQWRSPADGETHHIEILPFEASTGRLVPGVPITVGVSDVDGAPVESKRLEPYYAEFFHYANNFSIPGNGDYTLKATIGPPDLRRHGEREEGPALAEGAVVEFENVRLERE